MLRLILVALAAMSAGLVYFINLLIKKRRELDHLPCPPMKSRWLGHLDIAGDCSRLFPPSIHMQSWIPYIQKTYNLGDIFYIDWWPIGPRWLFISDPEVTSQYVSNNVTLKKSPMVKGYLHVFLGPNNLISADGQQWKHLRGMFNPGFSASHLMTLVPYIVDSTMVFVDILREKAKTQELIEFEETATRLTIDIIGKVVFDSDFNSQKKDHPIVDAFRERVALMPDVVGPIDFSRFEYRRKFKLWLNGRVLDRLIGEELDRKMAQRGSTDSTSTSFKDRKRSVVDLALDANQKEQARLAGDSKVKSIGFDDAFRQDAIDSLKTFIFAGHDTASSTVAYILYMLHIYPEAHRKVVKEMDTVFGPKATPEIIGEMIKADPYIINQLEYANAVIKEILRLFPPASTIRYQESSANSDEDLFLIDPASGRKLPMSGWHVWPTVTGHSRNEKFFPNPVEFIPERFIPSMTPFPEAKLFTPAGKDAWRPFEKGPRNCIGQELAMIETKVIMLLVVKEFDLTAEYYGKKIDSVTPVETYIEYRDGKPGIERMTVEGHYPYQVLKGAAKPRGGMPGRLRLRTY